LLQLSNAGGRIIIASDGVWDDLSFEMALECSRGYPSDIAANRIVNVTILLSFPLVNDSNVCPLSFCDILSSYLKEAILPRGLRDDTTCIVVDILPPEKLAPSPPTKWQGKIALNKMFCRKHLAMSFKVDAEYTEPDVVEELFEDGSAMLSRRYSFNQHSRPLLTLGHY
jgi:integrin-linked kinase-associated serine/threonine phosphatase 2C